MSIPTGAYCRVSTDREDQRQSFESQVAYFERYIFAQPDLELVEVYADRGLSGTTVRSRTAFARLLHDCESGRIGLILTKEVSRFARNTVDALSITRKLRAMGIGVLFLADGIDTRDGDGELRLAILASIAQEESRRTSQRVRWGQQQRMEAGIVFGNSQIFGYRLQNGQLTPDPLQGPVVLEMFQRCAAGASTREIANWLNEAGISPPRASHWSSGSVSHILRNEKYTGDLRLKKYCTPDYLSHKKIPNRGTEQQIFFEDHHPAIVPKELFALSQFSLSSRRSATQKRKSMEITQNNLPKFSKNERGKVKSNVI